MRKLALFAVPVLVVPLAFFATAIPAHASINSDCTAGINQCEVSETMGSGWCNAVIDQTDSSGDEDYSGEFAQATYQDYDSGYTCDFWVERNVNNTGWYQVGGTTSLGSSGDINSGTTSANYFNDGYDGYEAEVCFQFDWGSSLGAVHCSPYVTYG